MYDGRLRLSNQVVDDVKTHFQDIVFDTIVQRNTKLGEAPSFGLPVLYHDAESRGSMNYLNLAKEILEKNGIYNHNSNKEEAPAV
jgi:chromosome partitioning protein